MKKLLTLFSIAIAFAFLVVPVFAEKPASNNAGAQKIAWNLSAAVMPVPPYGSLDIAGSDTASKLIFNKPNGKVTAMVTGDMNGLKPNTTYTVYLSKGYTPFDQTGWSLTGNWTLNVNSTMWPDGNPYVHSLIVNGSTATGTSPGNTYTATVSVSGNDVTIMATYNPGGTVPVGYMYTAIGTIAADGSLSGTWTDTTGDSGTWNSTLGTAIPTGTGSTGWPGLLTGVTPFTFTTDSEGSGSWHYNFKDPVSGTFSVWINDGGTLLISDQMTF